MEQVTIGDYLKTKRNMEPEDVVNNNKETIQQHDFTNQELVGDKNIKEKQQPTADNAKQFLFTPIFKDEDNVKTQGDCCPVHVATKSAKKKHTKKTKKAFSKRNVKKNTDIVVNNQRGSPGDDKNSGGLSEEIKALDSETQDFLKMDLLKLQKNPEDIEGSSNNLQTRLGPSQMANEIFEGDDVFNHKTMSTSDITDEVKSESSDSDIFVQYNTSTHMTDVESDITLSTEANGHYLRESIKVQDILESLPNNLPSTDSDATSTEDKQNVKGSKLCTQSNQVNLTPGKAFSQEFEDVGSRHIKESNMEYLGLMVNNTLRQNEKDYRVPTFILANKHTELGLPKNHRGKKDKEREEHWPLCDLFGRRSTPLDNTENTYEELDVVAEENDSEKDESEGETEDGFINYCGSQDRLDPRKERHRYVSDKLDPDVLQLLEMHLRKQQLVDIKEEKEEELLDLHINKEKPRTESFKGFRNIPPVLDMVLEEPELEHTGEILEEDNQTPSEGDSDDDNSICTMEMNLIESLQCDLLSKTNKIDKHELTTIFKETHTDGLLKRHKLEENTLRYDELEHTCNDGIKYAKKKENEKRQHPYCVDNCGPVSEIASEEVYKVEIQSKDDIPDAYKKSEDQPLTHDDEVPLTVNSTITEPLNMGTPVQLNGQNVDQGSSIDTIINDALYNTHDNSSIVNKDLIHVEEELSEGQTNVPKILSPDTPQVELYVEEVMLCPDVDMKGKPCNISQSCYVDTKGTEFILHHGSHIYDKHYPSTNGGLLSGSFLTEQDDGVEEPRMVLSTDSEKPSKANYSEEDTLLGPSLGAPDEQKTLLITLEERMRYLLEKANAADDKSSRLQAEAELLWKESIELRDECKSLAKEAAEILSILSQDGAVHRNLTGKSALSRTRVEEESMDSNNTTEVTEETLICSNNATKNTTTSTMKRQEEEQLQLLRRSYSFLREEAPEVMRELKSLQRDLKSIPQIYNKPMRLLNSLLWGGLVTGGTMLLLWWSTKQLG